MVEPPNVKKGGSFELVAWLQATEALKPVLGRYYMYDARAPHKAMWEDFAKTRFVKPDTKGEGTLWFSK